MIAKPTTDLLFAYLMLYESVLSANFHWILSSAEINDLEWSKITKGMSDEEKIGVAQQKLAELLDDELYKYGNDFNFRNDGLTFDHDIQSYQGSTGKLLRFTIVYDPPSTYIITNIEDQLNGDRDFGIDIPHVIGSPLERKYEIE